MLDSWELSDASVCLRPSAARNRRWVYPNPDSRLVGGAWVDVPAPPEDTYNYGTVLLLSAGKARCAIKVEAVRVVPFGKIYAIRILTRRLYPRAAEPAREGRTYRSARDVWRDGRPIWCYCTPEQAYAMAPLLRPPIVTLAA